MTGSPTASRPVFGVPALVAAIASAIAVPVSFVFGIRAALDGSGSGSAVFQVVFILGLVMAAAAIVVSIVHLVRGARKALPIVTIVVALLPFAGVLVVFLVNLNAS